MRITNILGTKHEVGGQINVKISSVSYSPDGMPDMVGEAMTGTLRNVMVEEKKRNLETLLGFTNDEMTGLEVEEIPGKGQGVKVRARLCNE